MDCLREIDYTTPLSLLCKRELSSWLAQDYAPPKYKTAGAAKAAASMHARVAWGLSNGLGNADSLTVHDYIASLGQPSERDSAYPTQEELSQAIEEVLSSLPPLEANLLSQYFGLGDPGPDSVVSRSRDFRIRDSLIYEPLHSLRCEQVKPKGHVHESLPASLRSQASADRPAQSASAVAAGARERAGRVSAAAERPRRHRTAVAHHPCAGGTGAAGVAVGLRDDLANTTSFVARSVRVGG